MGLNTSGAGTKLYGLLMWFYRPNSTWTKPSKITSSVHVDSFWTFGMPHVPCLLGQHIISMSCMYSYFLWFDLFVKFL